MNPYEVLEIDRNADENTIKKAYKNGFTYILYFRRSFRFKWKKL